MDEADGSQGEQFVCPQCGTSEVRLCFPVWVPANRIDDRSLWQLDEDAEPESDSDKGWCPKCDETVLVKKVEVPRDGA